MMRKPSLTTKVLTVLSNALTTFDCPDDTHAERAAMHAARTWVTEMIAFKRAQQVERRKQVLEAKQVQAKGSK